MRRIVILACSAVFASTLAACGSSSKPSAGESSTTVDAPSETTIDLPTTSLPCQSIPEPTTPVKNPTAAEAVYLTKITESGDDCVDHVVFDFSAPAATTPGYTVTYSTSPVPIDPTDESADVKGAAVVIVKFQPAYGYNLETSTATYTGPKRIEPTDPMNHVTEIVQCGDFEAVMCWAIGLDEKRPFSVEATSSKAPQFVLSVG